MDYLPAYRHQLEALRLSADDGWRLYILEGDSRDGSHQFLKQWAAEDPRVVVGQEHVGFASEKEDRAARWARAGNACFDLLPANGAHTHVLWLEADLCFPSELVQRLLSRDVDVVAPIIYLGGVFYDTWGFRDLDGRKWTNTAPFHPKYRPFALIEMGSVGSCVLFRRAIFDAGIRFRGTYENGLLVGMCHEARANGFRVWADTATAILHPMEPWEAQMWRPGVVTLVGPGGASEELSREQAEALGLQSNVPLLDAGTLLHIQETFWKRILRLRRTNHLDVEVTARTYPRKSYDLRVVAHPPRGWARSSLLLDPLLKRFEAVGKPRGKDGGMSGGAKVGWISRQFETNVNIKMENE